MTTMIDTVKADEVAVLKQDGMGRVKTPAARREQLLDEFERSGLSGTKFAAMAGVKYQTFALWAQRRRRQRGSTPVADANRIINVVALCYDISKVPRTDPHRGDGRRLCAGG